MASSGANTHKPEFNAQEQRGEQFITARNDTGQFMPMGGNAGKDYGNGGREYGSNGNNGNHGNNGNNGNGGNIGNGGPEAKSGDMGNMLRHIESLESKLADKDRKLEEAHQRVEKFSARTREGMQSALDSLMGKWMAACETKDDKTKEQFKHGMEKLVQSSAEENGVCQMMVAASALHQRQEHDLDKLRGENDTLKQRIDGHYATSSSRTGGALGKRKAEDEAGLPVADPSIDDMWTSFASECSQF